MMCAARLRRLGVRALIIDKNPTIAHVWRNRYVACMCEPDRLHKCVSRYPNLTTQTTAHHCSSRWKSHVRHSPRLRATGTSGLPAFPVGSFRRTQNMLLTP